MNVLNILKPCFGDPGVEKVMITARAFYSAFLAVFFFDFGAKNNYLIVGFVFPVIGAAIHRHLDSHTDIDFLEKENISKLADIRNFLNRSKLD